MASALLQVLFWVTFLGVVITLSALAHGATHQSREFEGFVRGGLLIAIGGFISWTLLVWWFEDVSPVALWWGLIEMVQD